MAAEGFPVPPFPVPPRDDRIKILSLVPLAFIYMSLVAAASPSKSLIFATISTMCVSFMLMCYFGLAPDLPATPEKKKRLNIIFFVLNASLFGSMAANSALTMPFAGAAFVCTLSFAVVLFKFYYAFIYDSEKQ